MKKKRRNKTMENKIIKENVKMSSPWYSLYHKIDAMFHNDPEVKCNFNEDDMNIILYVDNQAKADALDKILPHTKTFGNIEVKITVKPSNLASSIQSVFKTAFNGNPILDEVITIEGIYENPITYVMFSDYIVQFWDDNLGDPHGNYTTLPQTIAQEVFEQQGVMYSTKSIE